MLDERTTEHLVAAVAMSLYKYNVSPAERTQKLLDHFSGMCCEPDEMFSLVDNFNWATEMAAPTALWYLQHALDKYGSEAESRVQCNLEPFDPTATRFLDDEKIVEMLQNDRPAAAFPIPAIVIRGAGKPEDDLIVMFLIRGPLIQDVQDLIDSKHPKARDRTRDN